MQTDHEIICEYWINECKRKGIPSEQYEKYANSPYMLHALFKGQLSGSPEKQLSPFNRWCEEKAEFDE